MLLSVGLWALTDDDRSGSSAAVWLFGFDTVKVDPSGVEETQRIDEPAFGSVAGGDGAVFMYDAGTGRVGKLDTRTGVSTSRVLLEPWEPAAPDATIVATPDAVWVASGPGRATRLEPGSLNDVGMVTVADDADDSWLTTAGAGVIVASRRGDAVELVRLDPAGEVQARSSASTDSPTGTVVGIEATRDRVWVVRERGVEAFGIDDLRPRQGVALPGTAGIIRATTATGDALWLVAENGAAAYRISGDGTTAARVSVLAEPPETFRGQSDIVSGLGSIWVLAPAGAATDDRSAVVSRIDPESLRVTASLDVPSSLFVGRIAIG